MMVSNVGPCMEAMPQFSPGDARLKSARQEAQIRKFLGDKKLARKSGRHIEISRTTGVPEKIFEDIVDHVCSIVSRCPTLLSIWGVLLYGFNQQKLE